MKKIIQYLKKIGKFIDYVNKHKAVEYYELEEIELRNTFAILTAGMFIGIPSPPVQLTLELLPYMDEDIKIMFNRLNSGNDPIGTIFSVYDIG